MAAEGGDKIINLRTRPLQRLHENEEVVASDEAFFESQTVVDEEALRNLYNEKSGVLDEPPDDEVDLTSEAFEIWSQATKSNPDLRKAIESLPDVVYATTQHTPDTDRPAFTPPGELTYISTANE